MAGSWSAGSATSLIKEVPEAPAVERLKPTRQARSTHGKRWFSRREASVTVQNGSIGIMREARIPARVLRLIGYLPRVMEPIMASASMAASIHRIVVFEILGFLHFMDTSCKFICFSIMDEKVCVKKAEKFAKMMKV